MKFSVRFFILCGFILFGTIVLGTENEEIAPNMIQIRVRIDGVNGIYYKSNKLHDGRIYYHNQDNSKYIYQDDNKWQITDTIGMDHAYLPEVASFPTLATKVHAYLPEDALFPTLATKPWFVYNLP